MRVGITNYCVTGLALTADTTTATHHGAFTHIFRSSGISVGESYKRIRRRVGMGKSPVRTDLTVKVGRIACGVVGGGGSAGRPRSREDDEATSFRRSDVPAEVSSELSTFWRAVAHVERPTEDGVVPCVPYLDSDGPLPFGAYRTVGREDFEVPRTCLVTVALDFGPMNGGRIVDHASGRLTGVVGQSDGMGRAGAEEAVQNMCRLIDAGFTTFQIAQSEGEARLSDPNFPGVQEWAEQNVYGRLRSEMPPSVLQVCHLMTRVGVPPAAEAVADSPDARSSGELSVRASIGASLRRMGGENIDSVQVPYVKGSPYHLDIISDLTDMQREGIIRSIGAVNFPPSLLESVEQCGFHLDTNQVQCNILDPQPFDEALPSCAAAATKLMIGSPLAGGLLTDRLLQFAEEPNSLYLSSTERRHVRTTLRTWAKRRDGLYNGSGGGDTRLASSGGIWSCFHHEVLSVLSDISHKYQVPVAAVALRWALTMDNLASVVVSSRVGAAAGNEESGGGKYNRHQSLRQLFTFELEEEDIKRLWDISGGVQLPAWDEGLSQFSDGEDASLSANGFIPDLSNKKLWL